jgi:hypothetical protein
MKLTKILFSKKRIKDIFKYHKNEPVIAWVYFQGQIDVARILGLISKKEMFGITKYMGKFYK